MAPIDPMANLHAFYDAQHDEISELFQDENTDWDALATKLVGALDDPFLPRCNDPEEQIPLANDTVEDMRRVLDVEGKTEEESAARLDPIIRMIAAVEDRLMDASEDEDGREADHAPGDIDAATGGAAAVLEDATATLAGPDSGAKGS